MIPSSSALVVIALGSNIGDRRYQMRRALHHLGASVTVVRVSSLYETAPLDSPAGASHYLNAVIAGITRLSPPRLLQQLLEIECSLGRRRLRRNEPRLIDLDLILYGAILLRHSLLTIPHPRYRDRRFVLAPLQELALGWHDPADGIPVSRMKGEGSVKVVGTLF